MQPGTGPHAVTTFVQHINTHLHRKNYPAPTFLRSPASQRWRWWAARSPRRRLSADTAALRTPGCWPSPPSARHSGRTQPAGSAVWPAGWGWTPRPSPGLGPAPRRTPRPSALLPCRRPARSAPSPWRESGKCFSFISFLFQLLSTSSSRYFLYSVCSSVSSSSRSLVAHLSSQERSASEFVSPHLRLINSHHLPIISHQEVRFTQTGSD